MLLTGPPHDSNVKSRVDANMPRSMKMTSPGWKAAGANRPKPCRERELFLLANVQKKVLESTHKYGNTFRILGVDIESMAFYTNATIVAQCQDRHTISQIHTER